MKYFFSVFVFGTLLLMACNRKSVPDGNTAVEKNGRNKTAKTGTGETKEAGQKTEEVVADPDAEKGKDPISEPVPPPVLPTPAPTQKPAPGEKPDDTDMGKAIYQSRCNKCHGTKNVGNYTMAKWESILKTMVPNAKLTSDEEAQLVAYIRANAK